MGQPRGPQPGRGRLRRAPRLWRFKPQTGMRTSKVQMSYAQAEDSRVDWEGALVQRASAGDTRAFERLVPGACRPGVRAVPAHHPRCATGRGLYTGDLYQRLAGTVPVRDAQFAATWLHRIAVNVSLGKRRKATPVEEATEDEESLAGGWTLETPVEVKELGSGDRRLARWGPRCPGPARPVWL